MYPVKILLRWLRRETAYLQASARKWEIPYHSSLLKYADNYEKSFGVPIKKIPLQSFCDALKQSRLILCGDYHSLPRSQSKALVILSHLKQLTEITGKKLKVALEMLTPNGLHPEWYFPKTGYEAILHYCHRHHLELIPLSCKTPLSEKDRNMAAHLLPHIQPETVIFALVGDFHLAPPHLPKFLSPYKPLLIHQNPDPLFWKIYPQNKILEFRKNEFALFHTTPWDKIEYHLRWIENETVYPNIEELYEKYERLADAFRILAPKQPVPEEPEIKIIRSATPAIYDSNRQQIQVNPMLQPSPVYAAACHFFKDNLKQIQRATRLLDPLEP